MDAFRRLRTKECGYYNFSEAHALAVNAGHRAALRATQQSLGWAGLLINHAVQVPRSSPNSTIW